VTKLHAGDARLDPASWRLLRRKLASWVGPDLEASLARFEYLLAEDSVRNECRRHVPIHTRLARSRSVPDFEEVNRWIYAELFHMPAADPWMGLAPREAFAVLLPPAGEGPVVEQALLPAGP
jgi:hypothetical protein